MLEAKSLNSTRVDVIEKTMASLYRASRVLCDRLLPASAPAAQVSETWKRYIPAPTLEFLLLTAALALSPASDRQALTFALDLVEQAEPLTDDWSIGLDLAMSRGVAGAERLAVLTASRHGDPLWGALAWAWRIRGMQRASLDELLVAFGLLDLDGMPRGFRHEIAGARASVGLDGGLDEAFRRAAVSYRFRAFGEPVTGYELLAWPAGGLYR